MTSAALIGVPAGSSARRVPLAHMVWLRSSTGSWSCGASPRNSTTAGSGKATSAPMRRVADHRATGEAGLLVGVGEDLDRSGAASSSRAARSGDGSSTSSLSAMSDLRPVHRAEADGRAARASMPRPMNSVVQAHRGRRRSARSGRACRRRSPRRCRRSTGRRACRPCGSRASRALRVVVGDARAVRREAGVLDRVGRITACRRAAGSCAAFDESAAASSVPLWSSCAMVLLLQVLRCRRASVGLRRDPHGDGDDRAETEDPDEQSL